MKPASGVFIGILLSVIAAFAGQHPAFGADKKPYTALSNTASLQMLDQVEKDIRDNYYDPSLHGFDLAKRFSEARSKIAAAQTQDDALLQIAAAVEALGDSHTRFIPPIRPYTVDYGFKMLAIGESACYVTAIRPGSDAEAKGLKAGDLVESINSVPLTRKNLNAIEFGYRVFPQSGFHLIVRSPDGVERALTVLATVTPRQEKISRFDLEAYLKTHHDKADWEKMHGMTNNSQFYEVEKKAYFWKLPSFYVYPPDLEDQTKKSREYQSVILDLRGNPGGILEAADVVLGEFFDHDVKVGAGKTRKKTEPVVMKGRGRSANRARLIVLIDSQSASASEIFARLVQLEKRGIVLGDQSAGHVMRGERFFHAVQVKDQFVTQYSTVVSTADLTMSDGKSLEHTGVTPDEKIVPSAADMAVGRDPVLARAAALAGVEMSSEKAGSLFQYKWPDKPVTID